METRAIAIFWKTAFCAALRGNAGFRRNSPPLCAETECGWLIINKLSYSIAMYCLPRQLNSGERSTSLAYCLPLGVERKAMKVL